jgi:hypothetical protein
MVEGIQRQVARVTENAARHTISRALKKQPINETSKVQEGVSKKLECMLLLVLVPQTRFRVKNGSSIARLRKYSARWDGRLTYAQDSIPNI